MARSSHPCKYSICEQFMLLRLLHSVHVVAFPILWEVLKILSEYSDDVLLDDAWSTSWHILICLCASVFWTVPDTLGLLASGISYPPLLFSLVESVHYILHPPLSYLFAKLLAAVYVPFLPVWFWCTLLPLPWCIMLLILHVWWYVQCWLLLHCFVVLLFHWIKSHDCLHCCVPLVHSNNRHRCVLLVSCC